jgi:hypothetical protein
MPLQNKQKQGVISNDTTSLRPLGLVAVSVLPCATSKSWALGFSSSWILSSSG